MRNYSSFFVFLFLSFCMEAVAGEPPLRVSWATTDYLADRSEYPFTVDCPGRQQFVAWRGERLHAKALIWSSDREGEVSFTIEQPENARWVDESTTGFMRYVMTDELNKDGKGGCGYRPDKTQFDSSLVADRIEPIRSMRYEAKTVQPVWITFDVPHDAAPGLYKGSVTVKYGDTVCRILPYSIRVIDRTLPLPGEQKFHLDLWQNPFAVARMAGVPLWSKEHFEAMRPLMERLAKAGQRGITASITHKPWNGQTYDYFENMITEIKRADGTWIYDYTVFDRWVEFMRSCGVRPYIYCYSVIPWKLTFRYYDQATNRMVDRKMEVSDQEFDGYWVAKLKAFASHLKEKGWFEQTIIAMDERPKESMEAALRVIRKADPMYKISLAGNYHEEWNGELFDYCIGYNDKYPDGVVEGRREKGKITTFYTCCTEVYPNTFTFSQPVEASALGLVAAERGLDGYLRWAYNSWVESPGQDSRFSAWAAGDTYLVYPKNESSARFEKLIEGIQMFEKIQVLKADTKHERAIRKLLQPFAHERINSTSLQKDIKNISLYLNSK
ncbi:DUF4091 domain-containing protein [Bacteroides helcogenes]|uniref:Uncharacterized protein n=1 Tax=Bacteroides helcogenes (strain ATCC 35417 / DSM 20613 / JCM 6297 / CCUG 15421 / P 36-108) TaxID=693979 RepID=E6SNX7_BACT6|nr:DUF4091 domain-containing protein [Bacteroides helcogenes]ADV42795.1 hypothetical protein Bache_0774 [Bacteroides helcogenes P 36-108]MDY5239625.1 DUF4091 domain-containing protein [Bacteroides helcogenes]